MSAYSDSVRDCSNDRTNSTCDDDETAQPSRVRGNHKACAATPKRHVFIVGCGFPQLGLIDAAKRLGCTITGADMNPLAVGVVKVDHFVNASTGDVDAICEAFKKSGASAMATSGSELALTTTSAATHRLGLPFYADPETIYRCQAKDAMRRCYKEAGLEVPAFAQCETFDQARAFVSEHGLPVVVKPSHGWGQRGVSLVDDAALLQRAFYVAEKASWKEGGVVVETFIEGHEVSVNGWVTRGCFEAYCVTDRLVFEGKEPLGVMRTEVTPSCLAPSLVDTAVHAAQRAARALGLTDGPCYCQIAVSEQRAVLFETAARLGGGFDADVTRLASGIDLYERVLRVSFDDESMGRRAEPHAIVPSLVRFIAPNPGKLLEVRGLERARSMQGVVDAAIYPRVGATLTGLINAASRVGHLLVTGQTREQVLERADQAEAQIALVMSEEAGDEGIR